MRILARLERFTSLLALIAGAALMIIAATDQKWNGLDLMGWIIFIYGVMRVMHPVAGGGRRA